MPSTTATPSAPFSGLDVYLEHNSATPAWMSLESFAGNQPHVLRLALRRSLGSSSGGGLLHRGVESRDDADFQWTEEDGACPPYFDARKDCHVAEVARYRTEAHKAQEKERKTRGKLVDTKRKVITDCQGSPKHTHTSSHYD
eukprot:528737-Rhodomonas_salina.1